MSYPMITTAAILLGIASTSLVSANLDQGIDVRTDLIDAQPNSILPQKNGFDFPHVDDELIVRFRPEVSLEERQALFGLVTGQTKYAYKSVSDLYCIKLEGSARDAFDMIKDRSDILMYAEPAYLMETFETPNDPDYTSMYGLAAINAPEAWDTTTGTSTTRIAIIDSGMDMDHPDLVDNLFRNPSEGTAANGIDEDGNGLTDDISGWDFYDNDNNPDDQNGHGTHTGGTVGAAGNNGIGITGINWECDLIALRVGNQSLVFISDLRLGRIRLRHGRPRLQQQLRRRRLRTGVLRHHPGRRLQLRARLLRSRRQWWLRRRELSCRLQPLEHHFRRSRRFQ